MDIKVDTQTVVVFDLDDTLYNEIDYLKSAYLEIAKEIDADNSENLFSLMFSQYQNNIDVFAYIENTYGISKLSLLHRYRSHFPKIKPFIGVRESLENIKKNKGKTGLISDGRSITQRNKLKALNLIELFDYIVISEEIGTEKPHENNYLAIEKQLEKTGHFYYIADNCKKDFITPNQRNWCTIGLIDNGLNIHDNSREALLKSQFPQHFIKNFLELVIV
ncbi:HAD family hydrolase [Paucihalobacter sp.]|uniref:HAD family hydrolase n=1 Tax=Paucihalobacter sp. TaxID=2850405 RepID=UPI003D160641